MNWRWLFSSSGRSDRKTYWQVIAGLVVATLLAQTLAAFAQQAPFAVLIILPVMIAATVANINIAIKRLHDLGLSGWWFLAYFAAVVITAVTVGLLSRHREGLEMAALGVMYLVMLVVMVVLGAVPGQAGSNRFGASPTRRKDEETLPA